MPEGFYLAAFLSIFSFRNSSFDVKTLPIAFVERDFCNTKDKNDEKS